MVVSQYYFIFKKRVLQTPLLELHRSKAKRNPFFFGKNEIGKVDCRNGWRDGNVPFQLNFSKIWPILIYKGISIFQ